MAAQDAALSLPSGTESRGMNIAVVHSSGHFPGSGVTTAAGCVLDRIIVCFCFLDTGRFGSVGIRAHWSAPRCPPAHPPRTSRYRASNSIYCIGGVAVTRARLLR